MSLRTWTLLCAASAGLAVGASHQALASGFALREQSGSMLGQAFAGQNAYTMDPSVIFFNPAGMSALEGTQASGVASAIFPKNRFNDDGSVSGPFPVPLGMDEGGDAGQDALVPAAYAMTSFGDLRLGLGVNSPYGLVTSYDDEWIGRFAAITSAVRTINVNPVASYRFNQYFSVGAGAQIQRIDARLTNGIFNPLVDPSNGVVELEADDWGFGLTAGALIQPMPGTQIGIGWRSSIKHTLKGDVTVSFGNATLLEDGASAKLETPETIGLSLYQQVNDRFALMGTVEWTNWSRFQELRVQFDSGMPDDVTAENWRDTFFYSVGANYRITDNLLLRGGVAYDETPVPNAFRTARLPDQDRIWTALGATYTLNEMISFDLGYTHIFVKDAEINEAFQSGAAMGTLRGEYENSVDIIALQANIRL